MSSLMESLELYDSGNRKAASLDFLNSLLKELRMSKIRRPDVVLNNWKKVLNYETGPEVWNLYEQICIAALDVGETALVDECIKQLLKKFPDSARAGRLVGMQKEQEGEYGEALEIYKGLLSGNPSNLMIMKRKVCVYKAMGDVKGMIEELNAILKLYPAEASSWTELGEVYLSLCDNEAAAHCFEELVILSPGTAHYHTRLADAYYSIGDLEHYVLARKHYTLSLTYQGPQFNIRAVYGVLFSCTSINESNSSSSDSVQKRNGADNVQTTTRYDANGHDGRVNEELLKWSKEQLKMLADQSNGNNSNGCDDSTTPIQLVISTLGI